MRKPYGGTVNNDGRPLLITIVRTAGLVKLSYRTIALFALSPRPILFIALSPCPILFLLLALVPFYSLLLALVPFYSLLLALVLEGGFARIQMQSPQVELRHNVEDRIYVLGVP